MNILINCQYYYPEQFLINEIAPELVKRGHSVTVLTGLPNYPRGYIDKAYKHEKKRDEYKDGVHIIRCAEIGRRSGVLFLALNYLSYAVSASYRIKRLKEKFDIVFSYELSPIMMCIPALKYKKKFNVPILMYCLDIWPESVQAHVKNDKGLFYRLVTKMSKKIYEGFDWICVTSMPFIAYLNEKLGIEKEKMCYLPQHADSSMINMDLQSDNGIVDFMYAGNIGAGQRVDVIIKAAALIKDKRKFCVHIVGYGSKYDEVTALARKLGVDDKVVFHNQQKSSDMWKFYKMADALILTLRGNNFVGNTLPAKLQMYMTAGKPILASINGAAREIIEESGCGASTKAADPDGLAEIMLDFIDNSDKYKDCGKNARMYFSNNFTKEIFMERLEKLMRNLIIDLEGKDN